MNFNEYQRAADRTASSKDQLVHAALGLTGEAGEFADAVKKGVIYGQLMDHDNLVEELGDLLWYVALGCTALGVSMSEVATRNITKLQRRYPERYTDEHAQLRLDKC